MSSFVFVEQRADFVSASRRAKEIAIQFNERTGLQRCEDGWAILASNTVLTALAQSELEDNEEYDFEDCNSDFYDDHEREVVEPLVEELQSDQDFWARSDEDGWFYED